MRYNKWEMKALLIPAYYLAWHYTSAIAHILAIYRNSVFFSFNFFSVTTLLRTIFRPFRRTRYVSSNPADQEHVIVSIMMSIVGFFVRTVTIICGVLAGALVCVFWTAVICIWLALPFISVVLFIFGMLSFFQ